MIYRVFEHYDDEQPIYYSYHECFICYDVIDQDNEKAISLKSPINKYKQCSCDGWTHAKCLKLWYSAKNKCPICRISILEPKYQDTVPFESMSIMTKIFIIWFVIGLYIKICQIINKLENIKSPIR
jgi:hypothetical protein